MSYTKYADIYLGDISSQALEFLFYKPRPIIFIDAHDLKNDMINRPISWNYGSIINNLDNLYIKFQEALNEHKENYLEIQKEACKDLFFQGEKSPSAIASEEIISLLKRRFPNA